MYFGKIILAAIEGVHKNNCYSMCKFVGLYLKRSYCALQPPKIGRICMGRTDQLSPRHGSMEVNFEIFKPS